jgi:hypothetical protein
LNNALAVMAALVKSPDASRGATSFEVQTEGGTLKLAVSIPDGELKRIIEAETAALSPVSTPTAVPETQENGPNSASDTPPVAPAAPPTTPTSPATPAAAQAALATARAEPKPAHPMAIDNPGDTIILTLPGKK